MSDSGTKVGFPGGLYGYYSYANTSYYGFDCLVLNAGHLPGRRANTTFAQAEERFLDSLCHELNHYILDGCLNTSNLWLDETFAENAVDDARPGTSPAALWSAVSIPAAYRAACMSAA